MITTHADVVGSLLRPAALIHAREDLAEGRLTDGEMRRLSFQSQLPEAVEGFGGWDIDAFLWGDWRGDEKVGDWSRAWPERLGVTGKLRRKRHLSAEEFVYLRARTTRTPKITLPSPRLWVNFWSADHSKSVYATLDSFLADVVDILRENAVIGDFPQVTFGFHLCRGNQGSRWLVEG